MVPLPEWGRADFGRWIRPSPSRLSDVLPGAPLSYDARVDAEDGRESQLSLEFGRDPVVGVIGARTPCCPSVRSVILPDMTIRRRRFERAEDGRCGRDESSSESISLEEGRDAGWVCDSCPEPAVSEEGFGVSARSSLEDPCPKRSRKKMRSREEGRDFSADPGRDPPRELGLGCDGG